MLAVVERILNNTTGQIGKAFIITGLRNSKGPFITNIESEPEELLSNFTFNKKKCLPESLLYLLEKTQMSISLFIYNNSFVNLLPLYAIAKATNG